jgi:AcrR family transcriptional regulator
MPRQDKRGRYHHGDLRAALVETAVDIIDERGVRNFSLAEASRRLGVTVSAPYAHFADRDDLLAAVTVHAYGLFYAEVAQEIDRFRKPADRLAAVARAYVRFAGRHRALFEVLFEAGLDKSRHPEIESAKRPIEDAFTSCVRAVVNGSKAASNDLAVAVEATAHGHAMLLLDGDFGEGDETVEGAAERAARATLALVESRDLLGRRGRVRRPT